MTPTRPRSHPPPWRPYLAALGVLPSLALAAFGFYALRREASLSRVDAQAQAPTLAQAAADSIANAALVLPFPSAADIEAWIAAPGSPGTEPLARIQSLRAGILARFASPRSTYPPDHPEPAVLREPDADTPLAEHWDTAVRTEGASGPSPAAAAAWQTTLDLAQGHPVEPIARFRLGAVLGRLGQVSAARKHLESLISPPVEVAGETGLPLDVLAFRSLLQIADADPRSMPESTSWYDRLAQRILLHWRLPEALIPEPSPATRGRLEPWRRVADLHARTRLAFLDSPPSSQPSPPSWSTSDSTNAVLVTSHPVDGGMWLARWPEAAVREGVARAASAVRLPEYLGMALAVADRPITPTSPGETLAKARAAAFPALSVTLTLARPEILEASTRRKTWIFGTLITLATFATLGGYLAALRATERHRQLATQQSEFVAAVSHELRAPLAAVRLLAEELIDLPPDHASRRENYHRLILREARRLGLLVDNVLRHSRLERRGPEIEPAPVDLSQLVSSAVEALQPTAEEREVSLQLHLPETPVHAHADPQAITQILVNLIDNALKHSPPRSTVTLSLSDPLAFPAPGRVMLEVLDQGPGIPAADHARIFEAFVRRGSELRRETPGVGLGLAIVHRLVQAHHGRIRVDSQPGQGARFTVELPLPPP